MAGLISRSSIDNILAKSDIVTVVGQYVALKKTGSNYAACCPFHDEKTPSFTVSPSKQFYYCFGCGAHGNTIGFIQDYLKLEFVEAVSELAAMLGIEVEYEQSAKTHQRTDKSKFEQFFEVLRLATQCFGWHLRQPHGSQARDYLKDRGLSGDIAKRYSLGFAPEGWDNLIQALGHKHVDTMAQIGLVVKKAQDRHYDRFRGRIMFPIRDNRGRTIAFGGRVLTSGDQPKYLNSPESPVFHKGKTLYGLYEAKQHKQHLDHLIVVEGYMDVIVLAQHGVNNAVATLGTAVTGAHFQQMRLHTDSIVCCFDGDNAGRQAAWRGLNAALAFMDGTLTVKFLFLNTGEDPDSFIRQHGRQAFLDLVEQGTSLGEFLFNELSLGLSLQQMEGRAKLLQLALPLLQKLPTGPYQDQLLQRFAKACQVSMDRIQQYLVSGAPQQPSADHKAKPLGLASQAIALLVQYPDLGHSIQALPEQIAASSQETALLNRLIIFLHQHHCQQSSELLQHWPDEASGQLLAAAAASKTIPQSEENKQYLADLCQRIVAQANEKELEELIEKSKSYTLTSSEKQHLLRLLQQK